MECFDSFKERITEVTLIAAAAEEALETRTRSDMLKANAMTRAGLVLLCGYFEGYIRETIEEFIDRVNDETVGINDLPAALFCSVIETIPDERKKNKTNTPIDKVKFNIQTNGASPLNKNKLSKTGGNPTVATVESMFEAIGIPDIIDSLSIRDYSIDTTFIMESQAERLKDKFDAALQNVINTPAQELLKSLLLEVDKVWQPIKRRRKVGYVSDIEEMLKLRNRIAHGEGRPQITPLELFDTTSKIESLASGINEKVSTLMQSLEK